MKIKIKDFAVEMELKNKGITLDVYDVDGTTHLGDIRFGKATIEWCKGRTREGNGKQTTWKKLIEWLESQ